MYYYTLNIHVRLYLSQSNFHLKRIQKYRTIPICWHKVPMNVWNFFISYFHYLLQYNIDSLLLYYFCTLLNNRTTRNLCCNDSAWIVLAQIPKGIIVAFLTILFILCGRGHFSKDLWFYLNMGLYNGIM